MHVLLIKTSSMGDVIHALPALTDAMRAIPGIRFDWVVEEAFQEIPAWHPAVDRVIPVALRRWRKHPLKALISGEWTRFKRTLRERQYDLVLDSQGLIKSAWLASKARGLRVGFNRDSARERWASWFYQRVVAVTKKKHAITRQRELFAGAIGYDVSNLEPDSALSLQWQPDTAHPYVVFLHGTSWSSKEWPEESWINLARIAQADDYEVRLTWGNHREKERADRISVAADATVLGRMGLVQLAKQLVGASRVIGVDSGLAHLTAALGVPAVTLYGATDSRMTGALAVKQKNIQGMAECAPCLTRICKNTSPSGEQLCWSAVSVEAVWAKFNEM